MFLAVPTCLWLVTMRVQLENKARPTKESCAKKARSWKLAKFCRRRFRRRAMAWHWGNQLLLCSSREDWISLPAAMQMPPRQGNRRLGTAGFACPLTTPEAAPLQQRSHRFLTPRPQGGDFPVSAILTSAGVHDSQATIPLAQRVQRQRTGEQFI